jgi:integrase
MRLSEAVGLRKEDIILTDDISYISIIPHPWRRLKTIESKRKVPLIGASLWGVKRSFIELDGDFLFPSFCDGQVIKSNSVSARLNKWLKFRIGDEYVVHSLRHSFRDRLRSIECPSEIVDSLGGWSRKSIGQSYGNGYDLKSLNRWISLINVFE